MKTIKSFNEFMNENHTEQSINEAVAHESQEELLIEHWEGDGVQVVSSINEASGEKTSNQITGIFAQAELRNRNGRIYPKAVLEKAVADYLDYHEANQIPMYGELNHPNRLNVDPMRAVIQIDELHWEGNNLMGTATVLEGDGAQGDTLMKLIRKGKWIPGVSTRGIGRVVDGVVQEGYKIAAVVDVVSSPSAISAFVSLK